MVGVALLVTVFGLLGQWQLHRLDQRRANNAIITSNSGVTARPADDVLAPGREVGAKQEWQTVKARGSYDAKHQILVRYRPLEGEPGFNVLTPFRIAGSPGGEAVLVNRGWIPSLRSTAAPTPPAPADGEVTMIGRVRQSESVGNAGLGNGQTRFIDVRAIAATLPYPVVGGYVELAREVPEPAGSGQPHLLPPPELSEGPHLAYAFQWFLFAVIGVGGVGVLAYDEAHAGQLRDRLRSTRVEPSARAAASRTGSASRTAGSRGTGSRGTGSRGTGSRGPGSPGAGSRGTGTPRGAGTPRPAQPARETEAARDRETPTDAPAEDQGTPVD